MKSDLQSLKRWLNPSMLIAQKGVKSREFVIDAATALAMKNS